MSDEFPLGWAWATLTDLCSTITDGDHLPPPKAPEGIPFLVISDINQGQLDFSNTRFVQADYYARLKHDRKPTRGDILYSVVGSLGIAAVVDTDRPFCFQRHIALLRPRAEIASAFLLLVMRSRLVLDQTEEVATGSAQLTVPLAGLRRIRVSLPPLQEQQRIVAKVEALLTRVNAARQRLAKVPAILKRFRQSVLAAACSGRLTADWREANPTPAVGEISNSPDVPDVPANWSWKPLSMIAQTKGGVTKGRKFNGKATIMLPYLRVANVQDGYLDLMEIKQIEVLPEDREKYSLQPDDILFTEGGDRDKLGRGTVWRGEIPDCIHQNHIFRARLVTSDANADYVSVATKSDFSRQYFFNNASQTVNLASLNLTMLSGLPIPLPPISEQHEIVRRVEALFRLADAIEKRVAAATARAEKLTQAILAKAFRGELVPTEAELARREGRHYEPASVLLERIRAEREGATASPTRQNRRRRPSPSASG